MMDCKKLREILDAYVDRELSADANAQAEVHIAECHACRRTLGRLTRLRGAVRAAVGEPEAPADLFERVQSSLSLRRAPAPALQSITAALIFVSALTLFFPSFRRAACTALDHPALRHDDSPLVL